MEMKSDDKSSCQGITIINVYTCYRVQLVVMPMRIELYACERTGILSLGNSAIYNLRWQEN